MKYCRKCDTYKDFTEFNKHSSRYDGYQSQCKSCGSKNLGSHYSRNKLYYKRRNAKKKRTNRINLYKYLSENVCTDCGLSDIRVLEFDHLPNNNKSSEISTMISHGSCWETIRKEIEKCEIVCCNCHRIRSINRLSRCWRNGDII